MPESPSLSASLEDYLEAIALTIQEKNAGRTRDIARRLHVSSSSVTGALHALAERRLINYEPYELISLTPEGESAAQKVMERHKALSDFFVQVLDVDEAEAEGAACKMEHCVSGSILHRLAKFAHFVKVCPRLQTRWFKGVGYFCEEADGKGDCERCIARCLERVRKDRAHTDGSAKAVQPLGVPEAKGD